MINKKQLTAIKNLNLNDILNKMNDTEFENYCRSLEKLIADFPAQETELKDCFKANDITNFSKVIWELNEVLTEIHADELAVKCKNLLMEISNPNKDMAEACLTYFLTSVSMLSIEIQMAKHKIGDDEAPKAAAIPRPKTDNESKQKNILAVDDVSLLLATLRAVLQNTEYKFTGVTSGDAALKFIVNHTTDLFLLDIEMPGMNGYELAAKLKEAGQTAPIIFLTGNAQSEYVRKAIQVGAVDFIVKPVNKEQVLEKIKKYIR